MKRICYAIVLALFTLPNVQAQESGVPIIKPEVSDAQVMFRKTVWRRMDCNIKQNKPFFSLNSEISRLLLEAVDEGLLKPYSTDSCNNLMPDSVYQSNITVERQGSSFGGGGFGGGFGGGGGSTADSGPQYDEIPLTTFDVLYFKEDLLFDRKRSRMYWYIRTVSVALPSDAGSIFNPAGFEKIVAHFKYDDVVALFRGPYADRAIWYNNQNPAAHRNFGDALELRLFSAPITKVSNSENLDIRQIEADPYKAVMLQQKMEYDLMEYESELWEN